MAQSAYFSNLPLRGYTLDPNAAPGDYQWVTDIFRRVGPIKNLLKHKILFYAYAIQDGDSPEIIAHKYYGDVSYHWVVCILNSIIDPVLDWPKNNANLNAYIMDRYGSIGAAQTQIHHWNKTISKTDSLGNTSEITSIIDETEYDSLTSLVPEVFTFSDGTTVTKTTSRGTVDSYTYEIDTNEAKRNILILNKVYLSQVVNELGNLAT